MLSEMHHIEHPSRDQHRRTESTFLSILAYVQVADGSAFSTTEKHLSYEVSVTINLLTEILRDCRKYSTAAKVPCHRRTERSPVLFATQMFRKGRATIGFGWIVSSFRRENDASLENIEAFQ